ANGVLADPSADDIGHFERRCLPLVRPQVVESLNNFGNHRFVDDFVDDPFIARQIIVGGGFKTHALVSGRDSTFAPRGTTAFSLRSRPCQVLRKSQDRKAPGGVGARSLPAGWRAAGRLPAT